MSDSVLLQGDCLEVLKDIPDSSIDSLVTDPPAGIGFMGKAWDSDKGGRDGWIAWMRDVMRECLRTMKPGAHGLVWAIPRTSHWTATALEDAGFEVRDVVTHLFGSGFPKSLDVSKAIDKAAGAEREVIGKGTPSGMLRNGRKDADMAAKWSDPDRAANPITAPASDAAKQWQGWGTALKPASEHWILVRKPCSEKTVAANVQKWGCGAINIDASRIGTEQITTLGGGKCPAGEGNQRTTKSEWNPVNKVNTGRFPANLVLSHSPHCTDDQCDIECAIVALDEQSGVSVSRPHKNKAARPSGTFNASEGEAFSPHNDSGGASRFFYCAKISARERNAGMGATKTANAMSDARPNSPDMTGKFPDHDGRVKTGNHHPTVKTKKLMSYLIRMITPPNGIVLDPFMGSGSTGIAAKECGFDFIGIEKEQEYFEIAQKRVEYSKDKTA